VIGVSKIMVVDDDVKILGIVRMMLEKGGYEVIVADSGEMCLEILKDEKPDLILMDVMMPYMDGWETVKRIRENRTNKDIKISMLTVKSTSDDMIKSLDDAGADWHLRKPIDKTKVLKAVDFLLKL
jgi:DNA-binding response OmpR family regulator